MLPPTDTTLDTDRIIPTRTNLPIAFFNTDAVSLSSPRKRQKTNSSSSSSINSKYVPYVNGCISQPLHAQYSQERATSSEGTSRMNNIRCISHSSSMQRFQQPSANATAELSHPRIKSIMQYYGSTLHQSPSNNLMCNVVTDHQINQKRARTNAPVISTTNTEACAISNSSSSVPDFSRIEEAINVILVTADTSIESQNCIADQLHSLATWTHSNNNSNTTLSCMDTCMHQYDTKPRSTTSLTVHQVAISIVSYNGINVVLNAMEMHLHHIEIQEYGCMLLCNLLAILYRRRTTNTSCYYDDTAVYETSYSDSTVNKGMQIIFQLVQSMVHHSHNVRVHCAAIVALQEYYCSVYMFKPNKSVRDVITEVLNNAHKMYLPQKIRQMVSSIIRYVQTLESNSC